MPETTVNITVASIPLKLVCTHGCGYVWSGALLPMATDRLARLLAGACCPRCGEHEGIEALAAMVVVTEIVHK